MSAGMCFPVRAEEYVLCLSSSFCWSPGFLSLWMTISVYLHIIFLLYTSVSFPRFLVFIRTQACWLRVHSKDPILIWSSTNTLFPDKTMFASMGVRTWTSFEGHGSNHNGVFKGCCSVYCTWDGVCLRMFCFS